MIVQTSVSVNRLNKFLNSEELDSDAVTHDETYGNPKSCREKKAPTYISQLITTLLAYLLYS